MFTFFAGFRASSSLQSTCITLLLELYLVLFELSLKSKVRKDRRSTFPNKCNSLFEPPTMLFHDICAYKGRRLHNKDITLEIPAAQ